MTTVSGTAEAAELEARALLAEQAMRHQREAEEDRIWRNQQLEAFRREIERDRSAQVRASVEAEAAVETPAVTPPRDAGGRWLPAAPEPEPEPDPAAMTMAEYAALRGQLGVHDEPSAGPSRRPGYTAATNQGMFDGLPGYLDPRSANKTVFRSQLEDRRAPVPPGFMRRTAEQGEWA